MLNDGVNDNEIYRRHSKHLIVFLVKGFQSKTLNIMLISIAYFYIYYKHT